jgi:hypothetical protein
VLTLLLEKLILVGATDHYKFYGENLNIYDNNSLYPHAMKKDLPIKPIKFLNKIKNLDSFFGFCLAKIETPTNLKTPLLPYRDEYGAIKYPLGC